MKSTIILSFFMTMFMTVFSQSTDIRIYLSDAKGKGQGALEPVTARVKENNNVFEINGAASANSFTSIQATFFGYTCQIDPSSMIELYKLEATGTKRIFSVIANTTSSVKIPVTFKKIIPDAYSGVNRVIIIIPNYLSSGEYAFINKSTLNSKGNTLGCNAFSIK